MIHKFLDPLDSGILATLREGLCPSARAFIIHFSFHPTEIQGGIKMGYRKLLKRAAGGLLAATLAVIGLPGGKGGFLAKDGAFKASALSEDDPKIGFDNLNNYTYYDSSIYFADESVEKGVMNIGTENKTSITVHGDLGIQYDSTINIYNGSYLIIHGSLYLGSNVTINC